ncbi:hypothetical protein ACWGK1_35655 [Streptomyces wedmorensis]
MDIWFVTGASRGLGARITREALDRGHGVIATRPPAGRSGEGREAVVDITEVADPPLRLRLGADAVERVEAKPDLVRCELDAWRHEALATGF